MKRFFLFTLLLLPLNLWAQHISVADFRLAVQDQTANAYSTRELDQNNEVCALIKVETTERGFAFEVGSLGVTKVVQQVGEVWVYVPHGITRITLKHEKMGVLRDYPLPVSIESGKTYIMKLTTAKVTTVIEPEVTQQYVVFTVQPSDAAVTLDGKLLLVTDGTAQQLMRFGTYDYRVECANYHPEAGKITVNDPERTVEKTVRLLPAFGWVKIDGALASDGVVYIDNVRKGTIPFTSENLPSGKHSVKVLKPLYKAFE